MDYGDDNAMILATFAEFDRNMSSGLDMLLAVLPSSMQEQPPPDDDALFFDKLAHRADVPKPDETCSIHAIPGMFTMGLFQFTLKNVTNKMAEYFCKYVHNKDCKDGCKEMRLRIPITKG
jgi:hypothetical protein